MQSVAQQITIRLIARRLLPCGRALTINNENRSARLHAILTEGLHYTHTRDNYPRQIFFEESITQSGQKEYCGKFARS